MTLQETIAKLDTSEVKYIIENLINTTVNEPKPHMEAQLPVDIKLLEQLRSSLQFSVVLRDSKEYENQLWKLIEQAEGQADLELANSKEKITQVSAVTS